MEHILVLNRLLPRSQSFLSHPLRCRKDAMPFLGSKKGAVLQSLVEDKKPKLAVEVGTMAGAQNACVLATFLCDSQAARRVDAP